MLSWKYDRKCAKKWTNKYPNCEVPGRDGQNSVIPWDLAIRAEDILTKIFQLTFDLT